MSRHRNIRNNKYFYEEDDYLDYEMYDSYPVSPSQDEFIYKRKAQEENKFSFSEKVKIEPADNHDSEIIQTYLNDVRNILGSQFPDNMIIKQLRLCNYDLDKTVVSLLEGKRTGKNNDISIRKTKKISNKEKTGLIIEKANKMLDSKSKQQDSFNHSLGNKSNEANIDIEATNLNENEDGNKTSETNFNDNVSLQEESVLNKNQTKELSASEKLSFEKAEKKTQEACLRQMKQEKKDVNHKQNLNMVVIGHVDAGKSTIMGHLLFCLGYVSKKQMHKYRKESNEIGKSSFSYAWVMDADEEERSRGVTMDVGISYFETATKHITLLDAPGHRDFISKMIAGASEADVAILVVPASIGEYEAAFENSGQTKEHALLVRSLGVTQIIVAINKMDSIHWSKERYEYIKQGLVKFLTNSGFHLEKIRFVPVSGIDGDNLTQPVSKIKCDWYEGLSLRDSIDNFSPPPRHVTKPFRMNISDIRKSVSLGQILSGRIYFGGLAVGDKILAMPSDERLVVKGMERNGKTIKLAKAGDIVDIGITGIDPSMLTIHGFLCSIVSPIKVVKRFQGQVITMPELLIPIINGTRVTLQIRNNDEVANVTKLINIKNTLGEIIKKNPRCISRNKSAIIEISCNRPVYLELFMEFRQLGRFTLRDRGKTLAAGIVTKIIE